MPRDAASCAAMADPDRNPNFRRGRYWHEPDRRPSPPPAPTKRQRTFDDIAADVLAQFKKGVR